jgi:hypothetical protein
MVAAKRVMESGLGIPTTWVSVCCYYWEGSIPDFGTEDRFGALRKPKKRARKKGRRRIAPGRLRLAILPVDLAKNLS